MLDKKYQVEYKNVDELIPYINNPRNNDHAVDAVASSIMNFGFKVPIVIDKYNEIINGHTRLKAAKKLGLEEVPVIVADELTEEQVRAFRLADNKVAELADWDDELLRAEMAFIGIDMTQFGFEELQEEADNLAEESAYTQEVKSPVYEITGEKPKITELFDTSKRDELVRRIQAKALPADVERFLIESANRHIVFNYRNIAEYYAHADSEVQELMEDSALIIIDYNKAIELGYVKLSKSVAEMVAEDEEA